MLEIHQQKWIASKHYQKYEEMHHKGIMWWANVLCFLKRCHSLNQRFLEKSLCFFVNNHGLESGCMNDVLNVNYKPPIRSYSSSFNDLKILKFYTNPDKHV